MDGPSWDEADSFRCVADSGARALLIGRQAMIALGLPVLTGDDDDWVHPDDLERFNGALRGLDFAPTHAVDAARARGRYVLEGDERIDVLVAREVPTVDGVRVAFDDVWSRREEQRLANGVTLTLPSLDDLIATKRFAGRAKDLEDLRLLEILRRGRAS